MSHELIALLMFTSMMLMLLSGQRVFGAIGIVATGSALSRPSCPRPARVRPGTPRLAPWHAPGHEPGDGTA